MILLSHTMLFFFKDNTGTDSRVVDFIFNTWGNGLIWYRSCVQRVVSVGWGTKTLTQLPLSTIFSSCPCCVCLSQHLLSPPFLFSCSYLGITVCSGLARLWSGRLCQQHSCCMKYVRNWKSQEGASKTRMWGRRGVGWEWRLCCQRACGNVPLQDLAKVNTNGLCDAAPAFSGVRACSQENYSLLFT